MKIMKFRLLFVFLLLSLAGWAQRPSSSSGFATDQKGQSRIAQIKIAKLTNDMKLTKTQAEKFWPVYNNYDRQRREINREINQLARNFSEDDDAFKKQERIQELKQRELDLTKKSKTEFLKVISEQQYGIMLTSEERFKQALLQQLKDRNKDE
jgi:Spy/CpxP family protein refolding chaperone